MKTWLSPHLLTVSLEESFLHQSAGDFSCNLLSCHTDSSPLWKASWFLSQFCVFHKTTFSYSSLLLRTNWMFLVLSVKVDCSFRYSAALSDFSPRERISRTRGSCSFELESPRNWATAIPRWTDFLGHNICFIFLAYFCILYTSGNYKYICFVYHLITKAIDSCFEIWERDCSFMFLIFFLGRKDHLIIKVG